MKSLIDRLGTALGAGESSAAGEARAAKEAGAARAVPDEGTARRDAATAQRDATAQNGPVTARADKARAIDVALHAASAVARPSDRTSRASGPLADLVYHAPAATY